MAIYDFDNIVRTKDLTHYVTGGNGSLSGVQSAFSQYAGTDYILFTMNSNYPTSLPVSYSDGVIAMDYNSGTTYGYVIFPISPLKNINKIEADIKIDIRDTLGSYGIFLIRSDANGTTNRVTLFEANPPSQMSDFQHIEIDVTNADVEYGYLAINYAYSYKATIKNIKFFVTDVTPSGGAGSGYIANSLVSNKKMVGYNVPTSSAESTKTESVEDASESPVSGKPKIGNGYARIKQITTIKSNALFVGANTEVVSLHKDSSNRKYLKLYDDYSICVMYYDPNYQYYGPLFLSTSENGVKYKTTGDRAYESTDFSTTIINGVSWKLAWSRYWLEYPDNDENWNLPVISGVLPNNADYWNYQYDAQEVTTLINAILNAAKE